MTLLAQLLSQFKPATLEANLDLLPEDVRAALPDLKAAFEAVDHIMYCQWSEDLPDLMADRASGYSLEAKALRHFNGPYNVLDANKSFIEGVPDPLPGKNVYPENLTEAEFDAWIDAHPADRAAFVSPCTVIERRLNSEPGSMLVAIPYAEKYRDELNEVAAHLKAAADKLEEGALKTFLENRAEALCGDYEAQAESDAEWVRLHDAPLEVVIGPFEVYSDALKGLKAFYEAMLLQVDHQAGDALKSIENALPILAEQIPCPAHSRPAMGGMAPMIVVDELLAAGEGRSGILASAFNLPNDAGVRGAVGWKQVMIRNVMQAKFDNCTRPIAARVLSAEDLAASSFDAYFFHVLLHEVTHGLGPAYREDGRSINEACGRWHTALEEAKADIGSLVLLCQFQGQFGIPALSLQTIGASFFAGLYRSIRFGLHEAHGRANAIQYNFLKEQGAICKTEGGHLHVVPEKIPEAAKALLDRICTLQACGTDAELQAFSETYGTASEDLIAQIDNLSDLPIDILPTFPLD